MRTTRGFDPGLGADGGVSASGTRHVKRIIAPSASALALTLFVLGCVCSSRVPLLNSLQAR